MAEIARNKKIKVASLFCGCGGMDLGLQGGFSFLDTAYEENPYEIVYAVDNDTYAAAIYNNNFDHKCLVKDVRQINPSDVPDHDLLIGDFLASHFPLWRKIHQD